MAYIDREAAIVIADYATDEHPYDKDPERPETFSEYNQGWHDACDYIRDKLENAKAADVAPVRHGRWELVGADKRGRGGIWKCTGRDGCGKNYPYKCDFCPNCGAVMDGGKDDGK